MDIYKTKVFYDTKSDRLLVMPISEAIDHWSIATYPYSVGVVILYDGLIYIGDL